MTLEMAVVCDRVCQAIGLRSVALSTLGGGGSTVCVTLNLVRRTMASYVSRVDGTLGADRSALGVGTNILGSEAWGWTSA